MLKPSSLNDADQKKYHAGLCKSHTLKVVVQILDTEHNILATVSDMLLSGQVDGQVVTIAKNQKMADINDPSILHTLTMSLMDPAHELDFDSSSPADGAVYLDRMIRVCYSTFMPDLGYWVDCPIFTGPITDLDRPDNGYQVNIVAESKERLAAGEADVSKTFTGNKVDICKNLLKLTGEISKYIDFPTSTQTGSVVIVRESKPWAKAYALSLAMSQPAFYDARGVARMANLKSQPVFTFNGDNVTKFPSTHPSAAELYNGVRVRAGTTTGTKSSIDVTSYVTDSNANSRTKLGRNGVSRNLIKTIDDSDIKTTTEAKARADTERDDAQRVANTIQLECFAIPHLELWDLTEVSLDNFYGELRVTSFSKPLMATSRMTVGYIANISSPSLSKIGRV